MSLRDSTPDLNLVQARSLWIGEIENWMDETFIEKAFLNYNVPIKSVKIIRDRAKGVTLGYGFVEFFSHSQAEKVLEELNDRALLYNDKTIKLNWASDSASKAACMGSLPKNEFTIYVGELNLEVTEDELKDFFHQFYPSVLGAKIIIDPINKNSKGYGFVRFSEKEESQRAILEMNGKEMFGKQIKVK